MRSARILVGCLMMGYGAVSTPAGCQTVLRLPAASGVLNHEFTRISGVRELADGRLLVSDGGDRSLWVVDWNSNRATRLGREGRGPGEYASAGPLLPLEADSTLLIDPGGSRHLLLAGDSIVETVAGVAPALRSGARNPLGADRFGHLIFTRAIANRARDPSAMPRLDSLYLLRVARSSGAVDTLARLQARPSRIIVRGPADRPTAVEVVTNPLSSGDLAVMFEDGWIAVARVLPYRVEWMSRTGQRTVGPQLLFRVTAVTEADKRDALRRLALQNGQEPADPASRDDWPERLPPFLPGALIAAHSGELWIRRTPTAGRAEHAYDVVSREGSVTGRLTIPAAIQVAGVGRALYVIRTDDDGIQRLARHPLPR